MGLQRGAEAGSWRALGVKLRNLGLFLLLLMLVRLIKALRSPAVKKELLDLKLLLLTSHLLNDN